MQIMLSIHLFMCRIELNYRFLSVTMQELYQIRASAVQAGLAEEEICFAWLELIPGETLFGNIYIPGEVLEKGAYFAYH